jgi:CubicO group peptidase (beta-lactamase class C family)
VDSLSSTSYQTPGTVAPGFEPVLALLQQFARADLGYSAQLCVIHAGARVIDVTIGSALRPDSLVCVFSSGKGIAGLCVASLVQAGEVDLDRPFSTYWPEFGTAGKKEITVRTALSHRAGLVGVEGGFSIDEVVEHAGLASRLAATAPMWTPGLAHGYHAVTIGTMIEELVARVTGTSFQQFYRDVQDALEVDFYFGVPIHDQARVVAVQPPPEPIDEDWSMEPLSIRGAAFGGGRMPTLLEHAHDPAVITAGPVGFGGIGNARSLAETYAAALANGHFAGRAVREMSQIHSAGEDLVLGINNRFGVIFQAPDSRLDFGSPWSFGHDGAGGALAYADPARNLAFAHVPSRMPAPPGVDPRGLALAKAVRECLREIRRSAN